MGLSDSVREFVFREYILPAVGQGKDSVVVRTGDIHREMGLKSRMPAVVSALKSRKALEYFERELRKAGYHISVEIKTLKSPPSGYGANVLYEYVFSPAKTPPGLTSHIPSDISLRKGNSDSQHSEITEDLARELMSNFLNVKLYKAKLDINGKLKEFDLVNEENRIVGDFKHFRYTGQAMAELSNIIECIWVMEKLEKYTQSKWRKIIVGAGNKKTFQTLARRYNPWLEDVEIYFIENNLTVVRLR